MAARFCEHTPAGFVQKIGVLWREGLGQGLLKASFEGPQGHAFGVIQDGELRLVSALPMVSVMVSSTRKSLAGVSAREPFAPDVAAVMHAVERDLVHSAVGIVDRQC